MKKLMMILLIALSVNNVFAVASLGVQDEVSCDQTDMSARGLGEEATLEEPVVESEVETINV